MKNNKKNSDKILMAAFIAVGLAVVALIILQFLEVITTNLTVAAIMLILVGINLVCAFVIRKENRNVSNIFLYNTILLFLLFIVALLCLL